LQWSVDFPEKCTCAIAIATTYRHNAQNIAYHEIGRQAIMTDPHWHDGNYYCNNSFPENGLAVARMTAHVTYLSEEALQHKFGRKLQDGNTINYSFDANFQVESYLRYQGSNFVQRFDPNSYLYITKAADYFDITAAYGGSVSQAFAKARASFCVLSFSSDWLYTTQEARMIVRALTAQGLDVSFSEINSPHGHDGFLLEDADYMRVIAGYLTGKASALGVL
jgi:homoserine O-acetyltransferase/O-succinyltransferase